MNHSSTCGFSPRLPVLVYGTGHYNLTLRRFSWKYGYSDYPLCRSIKVLSGSTSNTDLPISDLSTPFNVLFRQYARLSLLCHSIAIIMSTGILTSCPSTSPFGFALGPDLPWSDYRWPGNLSLPVCGFLARIIVTYAYIFFSNRSSKPHDSPSSPLECSPTNYL